jgi:hypothetical protein
MEREWSLSEKQARMGDGMQAVANPPLETAFVPVVQVHVHAFDFVYEWLRH